MQNYGKLVLAWKDEILHATGTWLDDQKIISQKISAWFTWFISNCILMFLLIVISISCYYYYTGNCIKKKYASSYFI